MAVVANSKQKRELWIYIKEEISVLFTFFPNSIYASPQKNVLLSVRHTILQVEDTYIYYQQPNMNILLDQKTQSCSRTVKSKEMNSVSK